jgi:hypothetical protein
MIKPWDVWMDEHLTNAFSDLHEEMKKESKERGKIEMVDKFKGLDIENIKNDLVNEIHDDELMEIWNDYCDDVGFHDDRVYYNDDDTLQMICGDYMSVAQKITYGNYNYAHEFLTLNGYANFETSDYVEYLIDLDDLAEWIIEQNNE